MAHEFSPEENGALKASEPGAEYGTVAKELLRVVSDEELERCIPLEESERLITEKIYRFHSLIYH